MSEVKKALMVGRAKVFDVPEQTFDIWNCPSCGNLFHSVREKREKVTRCMSCNSEVELGINIEKDFCWLCGVEGTTEHHVSPEINGSRKTNATIPLCRKCHDDIENLKTAKRTCIERDKIMSIRNFRKVLDSLEELNVK